MNRTAGSSEKREIGAMERYLQVAELHSSCIAGGFLRSLGTRFLSVVYRCIDEHPEAVLLTEAKDGEVVGFVAGTTGRVPLRSLLMRHPVLVLWTLAPSLLSLRTLKGIFSVAKYAGNSSTGSEGWPRAELLSIAVYPAHRGSGISERLFHDLEQAFADAQVEQFRIVVGASLEPALRYYARMGCEEVGRLELHGSAQSIVLARRLPGAHSTPNARSHIAAE